MFGTTNAIETKVFFPFLYKSGDLNTIRTGGWASNIDVSGYTLSGGGGTLRGSVSYYGSYVALQATEVSGGNGGICFFATKNRIDLTKIDKIQVVLQEGSYNGSEYYTKIFICPNKYYPGRVNPLPAATYPASLVTTVNSPTGKTLELEVTSIEGEYYVGIALSQWNGGCHTHIEIKEINLLRNNN